MNVAFQPASSRVKDAGITIRHSRARILFHTAGSRNESEGVDVAGTQTQKEVGPKKNTFFVLEKYVEDVKQEEKDPPDLVEPIMRPTDPVKEELRRILFKMVQFRPKIIKIRVSTFWMSGKIPDSRRRLPAGAK